MAMHTMPGRVVIHVHCPVEVGDVCPVELIMYTMSGRVVVHVHCPVEVMYAMSGRGDVHYAWSSCDTYTCTLSGRGGVCPVEVMYTMSGRVVIHMYTVR